VGERRRPNSRTAHPWNVKLFKAAFALLAALLFGASTPAAKLVVSKIDPFLLAGILYLGSGIGLMSWLSVRIFFGSPNSLPSTSKTKPKHGDSRVRSSSAVSSPQCYSWSACIKQSLQPLLCC
jgi:hypothetical protein